MRKVWITKYALTKGIYEMEVESESKDGKSVYGKAWNDSFHGEGIEWCNTKGEAVKRAEEMRIRKIKSLEKQIDKIKSLKFE